MKTLQQIAEGMFDVEDMADQGFEEGKMDKFIEMIGNTKVEFEIVGDDFIANAKNSHGSFLDLNKAPFIEVFGRTFDKLILQDIITFWIPEMYTPENYTEIIEINPRSNCYVGSVDSKSLIKDVTINMNSRNHELLNIGRITFKNCIINARESYSNVVLDGPGSDLQFLKSSTINLGDHSRLTIDPGKSSKSQISKLFGELYYHYRKFGGGTMRTGKAASDKILIKDVKVKKDPHWMGTIIDESGRPMMTKEDIDKITDFLGFKLNCKDLDYFIFCVTPKEYLQFSTQGKGVYTCEYYRI